jgi:hypothetical protein
MIRPLDATCAAKVLAALFGVRGGALGPARGRHHNTVASERHRQPLRDTAMTSAARYEDDVVAWSVEQARFLREGRLDLLDIAHLAEEIKDVGKSEQRELANRMAVLLAHLLQWQHQPGRRGASWQIAIRNQRRGIARRLDETPSLRPKLADSDWWAGAWDDATGRAADETGLSDFPETCPWGSGEILDQEWLPG